VILLIDQGNSALKWCLFRNSRLTAVNVDSLKEFGSKVNQYSEQIEAIYISCVKGDYKLAQIRHTLKSNGINQPLQVALSENEHGQLKNGYDIAQQLGVDRWLAMLGIWKGIKSGFIVVDAGSALTLDVVDNSGQHLGGHIIPGLTLQREVLLSDTDRIKINHSQNAKPFVTGKSTSTAVLNGCISNLCSYIEKMYLQESSNSKMPLFITGGDGATISKGLSVKHTFNSALVIEGLLAYFKQ